MSKRSRSQCGNVTFNVSLFTSILHEYSLKALGYSLTSLFLLCVPPCGFFVLKFPEMHILTPNWVTFPKISHYTRKKQFFEIWPFHTPVVTSLS